MVKKQDQLEAEVQQHGTHIDETLGQGDKLIRGGHRATASIKEKCNQVRISIITSRPYAAKLIRSGIGNGNETGI